MIACQTDKNDLIFVGEGEIWSAKITVNQSNGGETYQIQINDKEYDKQDDNIFSYYVVAKNMGVIDFGENNVSLNNEGIYIRELSISNSVSASVKDELEIKVEWDRNSESFTLIN